MCTIRRDRKIFKKNLSLENKSVTEIQLDFNKFLLSKRNYNETKCIINVLNGL